MSWICCLCNAHVENFIDWCEHCRIKKGILVARTTLFFSNCCEGNEYLIMQRKNEGRPMTSKDDEYAYFFNDEFNNKTVRDMELLELRAHMEKFEKIILQAKARWSADKVLHDELVKKGRKAAAGFGLDNENIDATEAVNTIKKRQEKLTKKEKVIAGLTELFMKTGMSRDEAAKAASTQVTESNILNRLKESATKKIADSNPFTATETEKSTEAETEAETETEAKPTQEQSFNPFE